MSSLAAIEIKTILERNGEGAKENLINYFVLQLQSCHWLTKYKIKPKDSEKF